MVFNHDWWFGNAYSDRREEARLRCALGHYPKLDPAKALDHAEFKEFLKGVEARTIVYLRDGFSYEMKELVDAGSTAALTFECTPTDEAYKVGAFVVTLPFDDIVRVEIFAVHAKEKPEDMPSIKGFSGVQPPFGKRGDDRTPRPESSD